jgi:hypothetical protein
LQPHQTSQRELDELRAVVDRDLKDAAIDQLSADRRFAVAYNAVQQLAKMVLACAGYRVSSTKGGHHATTFEAIGLILGPSHQDLIGYFDICRQKRNQVNYDHAGLTSDAEATELMERATEFRSIVENWIRQHYHPKK